MQPEPLNSCQVQTVDLREITPSVCHVPSHGKRPINTDAL